MVGASASFRNDVINGEIAELEGRPATFAPASLLAEQAVLVLRVGYWRVDSVRLGMSVREVTSSPKSL